MKNPVMKNLTLGAFAGYSNTDYKQEGSGSCFTILGGVPEGWTGYNFSDNGNIRSGVFGVFGRYVAERLSFLVF